MNKELPLNPGEEVVRKAAATCRSAFVPMGQGELILTNARLMWFSRSDILNLPFSLWKPEVAIELKSLKDVTSFYFLPTRPIRVRSEQGLHAFSLRAGSFINPLQLWKSRRLSKEWLLLLREQLRDPCS